METKTFEAVLKSVGDNGYHQWLLFWLLVVPFNFMVPWIPLAPIFQSWAPDHKCNVNGKAENITQKLWENYTIPWVKNDDDVYIMSNCLQFNITQDFHHGFLNDSSHQFDSIGCQTGWIYDQTEYLETITTRENWVCDREDLQSHWLSIGLAGNVVGTLIFNSLSDFIGRKPVFLITVMISAVFGVVKLYVTSYWAIILTQFISSMPFPSNLELSLIIVFEQVSGDLRAIITSASFILWTAGMCILPLIAWLTQHWVTLGLITSIPFCIFIPGWWLLPESPRWALSQNRLELCTKLLKNIAHRNKKTVPPDLDKTLSAIQPHAKDKNYGALQLLYHRNVWKRTILLTICYSCNNLFYYGLLYNISNMAGNEFLNFFLLGITELPANIIGWWGAEKLGRRWTESGCFIIASILCFAAISVIDLNPWWNIILLTISKLVITISFMVIYIQCAEIYPTSHRACGTGLSSLVSSTIGITSPYIASVGKIWSPGPYIIIALIGIIGGICASFLPETLGSNLPQSLKDGETFLMDQPYFSNFGWKQKSHNISNQMGINNPALEVSNSNLSVE